MPYGVSDDLWRRLPPDDQAAVKAGYEASQASAPPPSEAPQVIPATTNIGSGSAATSTDANGRTIYYTDGRWYYGDGTAAGGPGAPPPGEASGAGGLTPPDEASLAFLAFDAENRVDPGQADTKMPAGAFADFRDYFARDQPFLGTHIRAQGRGLKSVVASDLWSPST